MNVSEMGIRIKKARIVAGYTQSQFAELAFISESYMALIELGKRNPSLDVLIKISEILGVTIDYLVFGTNIYDEQSLYREWFEITKNRNPQEIKSANILLKEFFSCIDTKNR